MPLTLEDVAAELYRLPPSEFTATRNARAKDLREQDRALADAVAGLPKPALPAWALDLFAHERPDDLEDLLDLGAQLREAQQALSKERLRALTAQAHGVVQAVVAEVGRVAGESGTSLSDAALAQVEQSLRAAMADASAADAVRAGLLAKPLEPGGFGAVDLSGAVAGTPRPAARRPSRPKKGDDRAAAAAAERRAEAERAAAEALDRLERAEEALAAREREADRAEEEHTAAVRRVEELEAELASAKHEKDATARAAREARRDRDETQRQAGSARKAADQAREGLG